MTKRGWEIPCGYRVRLTTNVRGAMDRSRVRRNSRAVQEAARGLRRSGTTAEEVLWDAVRDRKLEGLRFRRQHPVGNFIFDFYCPIAKLVVEVDGDVHDEQPERDAARDAKVAAFGCHTLRVRNEEVLHDLPAVLARIGTLAVERRAALRGTGKYCRETSFHAPQPRHSLYS